MRPDGHFWPEFSFGRDRATRHYISAGGTKVGLAYRFGRF